MSPGLRPLRLPLLVERRRKQEEEAAAVGITVACEMESEFFPTYQSHSRPSQQTRQHAFVTMDSMSSDITPPTPTSPARGHLRYSSSMSSFDLAIPAGCEDLPPSPTQIVQTPCKRILDDVEEEPFEYDRFNNYLKAVHVAYDDVPEHFDLYDCLCDEPCVHRDTDIVRTTTNFYGRGRIFETDLGCLSDSDSPGSQRSSRTKQRNGSLPPFMGLSYRIGARFPSLARWRSPRKPRAVGSPVSDRPSERRSMSRAASSRSSSVSRSNRYLQDRSNEPPLSPTPGLSFESSDSIILSGPLDVEQADHVLSSIQRERAQATTPLLPPMMASSPTDYVAAQPSPLQSPSIASPLEEEPQSPLILSPPLSTKPSISSFRQKMMLSEIPPIPEQDAWSDRLGHANFTIVPVPYKPLDSTISSLHKLRADWEAARVNYTKHLVRTGEHYSLTSKTYELTEQKWAEIDGIWRKNLEEIMCAISARGETIDFDKFDENIITTVPIMDGEGKFPERGDEDIVGPMVREATMTSPTGSERRRRPSFWRNLTDRVGLRK
ncbi:hypothetical protein GGR51DRAFT_395322 [Nemania sp. FL0031]|nr:hypothetical protein GGR51DRAFT_395322 [Nemania sp. FL0031]